MREGLNAVRVKVEIENSEGLQVTVFDEIVDNEVAVEKLKLVLDMASRLEHDVKRYWEALQETVVPG